MAEIKVSLRQTNQNVNATIAQTSQSMGVNMEMGIVNKVYHDDTLKGDGRPENLLGLSESIIQRIDRGGDTFIFDFDATSTFWVIYHNLNKRPSVTVVDSTNAVVESTVEYLGNNAVQITLNSPFKGQAYLN